METYTGEGNNLPRYRLQQHGKEPWVDFGLQLKGWSCFVPHVWVHFFRLWLLFHIYVGCTSSGMSGDGLKKGNCGHLTPRQPSQHEKHLLRSPSSSILQNVWEFPSLWKERVLLEILSWLLPLNCFGYWPDKYGQCLSPGTYFMKYGKLPKVWPILANINGLGWFQGFLDFILHWTHW